MGIWKHQGKYRYQFELNGKKYRKGGFETKREAKEAQINDRKKKVKRQKELGSTEDVDIETLCDLRLEEIKNRCTPHYYDEQYKFVDCIKYGLRKPKKKGDGKDASVVRETKGWKGNKYLTKRDIDIFLFKVNERSGWMANKYLKFFRAMFRYGIENRLVDYDPTKSIKFFGVTKKRRYVPPYDDIAKVLAVAEPEERQFLEVIIYTLARVNEIYNLEWEDIFSDYLILKTKKSKNSDLVEREIPLNEPLKEVIRSITRQGDYVFINPLTGTRYRDRKRLLAGLCKNAGVKRFTYHCLRHYGASKLSHSNAPLAEIQTYLGHADAVTTSIYLHSLGLNRSLTSLNSIDFRSRP